MKKRISLTLGVFLLLTSIHAKYAHASGCNYVVQEQIIFPRGSVCWSFEGRANTFVGEFAKSQKVSVKMLGRSANINDPVPENHRPWEKLDPGVSGPHKYYESGGIVDGDFSGRLDFTVPATGTYQFNVSPCSYWSSQVRVEICAR